MGLLIPIKQTPIYFEDAYNHGLSSIKIRPGDVYGRFTVLERAANGNGKNTRWLCICECGTKKVVLGYNLRSGDTTSCGCRKREMVTNTNIENDLTGKRFGRWIAIKPASNPNSSSNSIIGYSLSQYWICECDCGDAGEVEGRRLVCKGSSSCGCLGKDLARLNKISQGSSGLRQKYTEYKCKARQRGIVFSLSLSEFNKITEKNCFYCNAPPKQKCKPQSGNEDAVYTYNGIDRANYNYGYTLDNCLPCCSICNFLKSGLELIDRGRNKRLMSKNLSGVLQEFLDHIQAIATHQKNLAPKSELI